MQVQGVVRPPGSLTRAEWRSHGNREKRYVRHRSRDCSFSVGLDSRGSYALCPLT